ncbi:carboxymuconolactone decarboxylase family protein [Fulvivirgaceae bacterium BMA10]|uniref:Carboxymuconolactone decarboxylase family protein n=1 Tax=Splendidivirga corallicola TaxID=3051826 RepID=A0ABT8KQR0_9BACT|nr:carboxymuconolactone decarboxylase family protein [Fulvivirgaceae bacterium BMA10]
MKNLEILSREQVAPETQQVFDNLKGAIGMVPNLYATAANSHKGLTALLGLGDALKGGEFSGKEVEAIALAVGEANGCNYCLSAHTAIGKMQGFTEEETVKLRTGEIEDGKLNALTSLAKEITETRGLPSQDTVDRFFSVGYNKAALVELIGFVANNTFTNYLNHIADTTVDFPKVSALNQLA